MNTNISPTGVSDGLKRVAQAMIDRNSEQLFTAKTLTDNYAGNVAYMMLLYGNEISLYVTYTPVTVGDKLYIEPGFSIDGMDPFYILQKLDIATGAEIDDIRTKEVLAPLPAAIYAKISMKCDVTQYIRLRVKEDAAAGHGTISMFACVGR